jgi:hypothetical protein
MRSIISSNIENVLLPELIDGLQQDELLQLAHHRRGEAGLALLVGGAGRLAERALQLGGGHPLAAG